jgi:hypothetical protein
VSVHAWFKNWLRDHRARHPGAKLPDTESEMGQIFFRGWTNAILTSGIHDRETWDAASEALMAEDVRPAQHFARLVALAKDRTTPRPAAPGAPEPLPSTREAAEAASRECEHCGGGGWMTVVYSRSEATRSATNPTSKIPPSVSAFCGCAHGRFLKRSQAADLVRRIPDLADVLEGRSGWTLPPEPTPEERRHYGAMVIEALNRAQPPQPPRN